MLLVLLFICTSFVLGCNEYMLMGVISDINKDLGISLSSLGLIVSLFALVYAISTPFVTIWGNRFKRHHFFMGLLTVFLIGNTLSAVAVGFWSLLFSRIVAALTAGVLISVTMVFANYAVSKKHRASAIAWIFAGFNIASIAGVPIGTFISTHFSWRLSFLAIDLVTIFVAIMFMFYLPKDTPQSNQKINVQRLIQLLKEDRIIWMAMFVMCMWAAQFSYYTYIRPILTEGMGFSTPVMNALLFVFGFCAIIGNNIGAWAANHGGQKILAPIYLVMTISQIICGCLMKASPITAFIFILVAATCSATFSATIQVNLLDIASKEYTDLLDFSSSLNPVFSNFGVFMGSFAASELINFVAIKNVVYLSAGFAFLAFLIMLKIKAVFEKY